MRREEHFPGALDDEISTKGSLVTMTAMMVTMITMILVMVMMIMLMMVTFGVPVASQLSVTARPSVASVSLLELSSMMFGGTEMV